MTDGSYMIFEICNVKWFPVSQNRLIIWLLDFLPVLAVNLGLPLKAVILSWSINYYLFYLICLSVVILYLKDATAGWTIIALRCFTTGPVFFNMANEMLPGAVLIIVLMSLIRNRPDVKWAVLFLLFFIAFAHPLVLVSVFMLAAFAFMVYPGLLLAKFKENKRWVYIFAALVLLRFTMAAFEPYESGKMALNADLFRAFISHLNSDYLIATIKFIGSVFTSAAVVGVLMVSYMLTAKMYKQLFWALVVIIGYSFVWLLYLNPEGVYRLNRVDHVTIRYMFPIVFFIIVSFFLHFNQQQKYMRGFLPVLLAGLLTVRFINLYSDSGFALHTVKQVEALIDIAHQKKEAKLFVRPSVSCDNVYRTNFYTASIIYSALEGRDSTVHVILPQEDKELGFIAQVAEDQFYQSKDAIYSQKWLNPEYFNLKVDKYNLLDSVYLDCVAIGAESKEGD